MAVPLPLEGKGDRAAVDEVKGYEFAGDVERMQVLIAHLISHLR